MNSLVLAFSSACCAAGSNLFFRKNSDSASSPNGYLLFYYLCSLLLSFVAYPPMWTVEPNIPLMLVGATVGTLNSALMFLTFKALKEGPANLTFAFQNSSTVFPGFILYVLLGSDFGFSSSYMQFIGMILVITGLFWGTKKNSTDRTSSKWLRYITWAFLLQILAFCCIQLRCLLLGRDSGINFDLTHAADAWYMVGQFSASLLIQAIIFIQNKRTVHIPSMRYGLLGGICNFSATWLLLLATKYALPLEKGVVFPCFAVGTMILCNVWAKKLYNESFIARTHLLCSLGLFVAAP
jgi:hypothetical protein